MGVILLMTGLRFLQPTAGNLRPAPYIAVMLILAGCSQPADTGPNPLIVHFDKVQADFADRARVEDEHNRPENILLYQRCSGSLGPMPQTKADNPVCKESVYNKSDMLNLFDGLKFVGCVDVIEQHNPNLVKSSDPAECDKDAAQLALAFSKDLSLSVTATHVQDPAFWQLVRNAGIRKPLMDMKR